MTSEFIKQFPDVGMLSHFLVIVMLLRHDIVTRYPTYAALYMGVRPLSPILYLLFCIRFYMYLRAAGYGIMGPTLQMT